MKLAGAQNKCLRHNHLKIHKVGNDASRRRDLCVGDCFCDSKYKENGEQKTEEWKEKVWQLSAIGIRNELEC